MPEECETLETYPMPEPPPELPAAAPEVAAAPPETFPMGIDEYVATTGLHYLWAAGLAYVAGPGDRLRAEWDALLAAYQARPVQTP